MNTFFAFVMPGMTELLVIGGFIIIFFGARKIPEFARGMGKGIREFKNALSDVKKEVESSDENVKTKDKKDNH